MSTQTITITDNRTGKSYTIPVEHGAIKANDLRQIKLAEDDPGLCTYDPGFMNTAACKSRICYIDGKQGRFGDQWLGGESDNADLSIFAAKRTKDGAVTVAVVNKNLNGPCTLTLDLAKIKGKMRVWRFDQDTGVNVVEVADQAGAVDGAAKLTLPAASASMVVSVPE